MGTGHRWILHDEIGGENADIVQAEIDVVIAEADEQLGGGVCGQHAELQIGPVPGGEIDLVEKSARAPRHRKFVGCVIKGIVEPERDDVDTARHVAKLLGKIAERTSRL